MKRTIALAVLCLALASCKKDAPSLPDKPTGNEDFHNTCLTVLSNIREQQFSALNSIAGLDKNAKSYLDAMDEKGTFPDVDYADKSRTNWAPLRHWERLRVMATAYAYSESNYYKDTYLLSKISSGLERWNTRRPSSDNWWYNQIAAPRELGLILVLLREPQGKSVISKDLEDALLGYWAETGGDPRASDMEGANKVDIALHWLYRACLTESREMLDITASEAFAPFKYTSGEGIQYDNSYFQHHEQLYLGGYAFSLLSGALKIALYTQGTDYSMTEEQKKVLRSFVLETLADCSRGDAMFYNALGRSVSRAGAVNTSAQFKSLLAQLKVVDSSYASQYEELIALLSGKNYSAVPVRMKQYYIGDYSTYICPDYSVGLRTVSDRTYRCEYLNGENSKGYFISDGSMSLNITGEEYFDIFPAWDWNKVPGTTATQSTLPFLGENRWTHQGESDFVGGVSDEKSGVTVYKMVNTMDGLNLFGNKSWFFEGSSILCKGTAIRSSMPEEVATTVNQCHLSGEVHYRSNGSWQILAKGASVAGANIDMVWHDNVGYIFDAEQDVHISAQSRSGDWHDINTSQSGEVSADIFLLYLSHGSQPSSAGYSYSIVPGVSYAEFMNMKQGFVDVSPSESVHAVYDLAANALHAAFFEAGSVSYGDLTLVVDKPCTVMCRPMAANVAVYISDPSHKASEITVTTTQNGAARSKSISFASDSPHLGRTHYVLL